MQKLRLFLGMSLAALMLFLVAEASGDNKKSGDDKKKDAKKKEGDATVKVVKYDKLQDAIKGLKGKIVLVDYWSTT